MRNPLRRFYGHGDLHFVTFSCYRRRPYLGTVRARNRFVRILDDVRSRHKFHLLGYVVMPEHVPLLMSAPASHNPSRVIQVLKQKVSRTLRSKNKRASQGQWAFPFVYGGSPGPAFWQRRFYDFNLWSEKKLREKLNSTHRNPV